MIIQDLTPVSPTPRPTTERGEQTVTVPINLCPLAPIHGIIGMLDTERQGLG